MSKEHGKRLEELATDRSLMQHTPLQAWAARAWGSSRAHSPGRAVDYACHYGDFSVPTSLRSHNSSRLIDPVQAILLEAKAGICGR